MKKMILALAMIILFIRVDAQRKDVTIKDVPQAVANSFTSAYHSVKSEWHKVGKDFEAAFDMNGVRTYAVYDNDGKLVRKEVVVKYSELPQNSRDYVKTAYGEDEAHHVRKVTLADGTVTYRGVVKDSTVYFDKDGKFLRSEKAEIDED